MKTVSIIVLFGALLSTIALANDPGNGGDGPGNSKETTQLKDLIGAVNYVGGLGDLAEVVIGNPFGTRMKVVADLPYLGFEGLCEEPSGAVACQVHGVPDKKTLDPAYIYYRSQHCIIFRREGLFSSGRKNLLAANTVAKMYDRIEEDQADERGVDMVVGHYPGATGLYGDDAPHYTYINGNSFNIRCDYPTVNGSTTVKELEDLLDGKVEFSRITSKPVK